MSVAIIRASHLCQHCYSKVAHCGVIQHVGEEGYITAVEINDLCSQCCGGELFSAVVLRLVGREHDEELYNRVVKLSPWHRSWRRKALVRACLEGAGWLAMALLTLACVMACIYVLLALTGCGPNKDECWVVVPGSDEPVQPCPEDSNA